MEREIVKSQLEVLIKRAEKTKNWLYCHYQDLWFSPEKLREENENGRFLWGPVNWDIKSPLILLKQLKETAELSNKKYEEFKELMKEGGYV